ncbi:50S ribosomal protein L25/general stress protein Ctc [Paramicrobacterium agarici]|uniref:Large ribosomal subunit protein bL25 n=1 Tax=Paramicrobacterium agarici TaxID=630514 RepID=A0A2A9DYX9_9MICO|nr:50S ribosomal protein L25/general stress protein Ctc [Microbacterium agarici]PFG31803.1 LSU ribosomal protein L25P [Microbacterium agarici]TQO21700.1 LSU ribosomal protein L25P [Microbacterium agarici]
MAEQLKLSAETRESFGKGAARKLRAAGKIPAVVYGHGAAPLHLTLPGHETMLLLRRSNALIEIDVDGKKHLTLVKDVQRDPVSQIIEHVDLIVIKKGERVDVEVPVHLEGESFSGTIVMVEVTTVRLNVAATNIPESLSHSIEGAVEGTQVLAGDITLPEGAELAEEADLLLAHVTVPSAPSEAEEEAAEAAAAEEAAEGASEE